jgi:hypothetical protein
MESFYTFANFFRILTALGLLFYLVPHLVLKSDSPIQKILTLTVIALTVFMALIPVTPREETRLIMTITSWILAPGAAAWLIFFIRGTGKPDLRQYQAWIIDTLRESVLIFDQQFNLQESSGLQKELSPEKAAEFIDEITALIKPGPGSETPAEGFFRFGERTYRYRFQPVNRGFLLTILDLTEEQLLLDELLEKNQLLQRQHTLLETADTVDLQIRREKYRQNLSSRIIELVRENLLKLQDLMNHPEDITPVLRCAEEAMADIRLAVGQLARGGNEK